MPSSQHERRHGQSGKLGCIPRRANLLLELLQQSQPSFHGERCSFVTLTVGVTLSNVGMATAGKTLGILEGTAFYVALVYYVIASLLGLVFSIVSATACDQGIFTPLSSVALILVNMMTGVIVWEDYKVIDTWLGYICACMLMCLGVYLLAEVDVMQAYSNKKGANLVQEAMQAVTPGDGETKKTTTDAWQESVETTKLIGDDIPTGYSA